MKLGLLTGCRFATSCIAVVCCSSSFALDFETAADVAFCRKRPGYQKDGDRAVAVLRKHKIYAERDYHRDHYITEDSASADYWVICVNVRDAAQAWKWLTDAIKQGLRIRLVGVRAKPNKDQ